MDEAAAVGYGPGAPGMILRAWTMMNTGIVMTTTETLRRVSFTVAGLPAPQGSKRAFANHKTGRVVVTEMAGEKLKEWRSDVRDAACRFMLEQYHGIGRKPLEGPLGVSLAFTLPKPKSAPKNRRTWPDKRPDLDKLVRSTLDGLTGPVFADDAQVIALQAIKLYPDEGIDSLSFPGVKVRVWQIGENGHG